VCGVWLINIKSWLCYTYTLVSFLVKRNKEIDFWRPRFRFGLHRLRTAAVPYQLLQTTECVSLTD
jgi:hypothetical protein